MLSEFIDQMDAVRVENQFGVTVRAIHDTALCAGAKSPKNPRYASAQIAGYSILSIENGVSL